MKSKAVEAYTACLDRAAELGAFHPSIAKAEERRANLTAERKTTVEELIHEPFFVDDAIATGATL